MRRIFLSLLWIFALLLSGKAQQSENWLKAQKQFQYAKTYYEQGQNKQALERACMATKLDSLHQEAHLLKATIYQDMKINDSAILSYRRVLHLDPDFFPNSFFTLAKLEASCGQYEQADLHFESFLKHPKSSENLKKDAQKRKQRNVQAWEFYKKQVPFEAFNLGDSINTQADEYLPVLTTDGLSLIITRRYYPEGATELSEDFFISKKDSNGQWQKIQDIGTPINTRFNEGSQSISPDGRFLFFAGCGRPEGYGSCDIYCARKQGEQWGQAFNLAPPINTSYWESQACMAPDGKTLYFCSNRPQGKGGSDIWFSYLKNNGTWAEPINAGDSINTPGEEFSPFIHPDGKTLYFSSNAHPGLGGMDLFYSKKKENGAWSKPINLGYPINTYSDEVSLFVNTAGDTAYFASDQLGGMGGQDIYAFALYKEARPAPVSFRKGRVLDADSLTPISAKFELIRLSDNQLSVGLQSDSENGEYLLSLPYGETYALHISKEGYLFYSEHITLDSGYAWQSKPKDILLKKIKSGESLVLENIFFETNQYHLKEISLTELNKLYESLRENPLMEIEISGHTDNSGNPSFNLDLSQKRAQAVKEYLIEKGIAEARLRAMGYGAQKPIADNTTEFGKALNRRTEIKIL